MLFSFLMFLLGVILVWFSLFLDVKFNKNNSHDWLVGCFTVSVIFLIVTAFSFGVFVFDYMRTSTLITKELVNREVLVRLLDERYDSDNLKNALKFNAEQKLSSKYNESILWYCWENCYSLDTIEIPSDQYVPQNIIEIKALLKKLEELPEEVKK